MATTAPVAAAAALQAAPILHLAAQRSDAPSKAMDSAFARILSSGLATEICHRLPDPRSRFLCATLCRLHTLQVDALCDLRPPAALLDRVSLRGLGVDDRLKAHFEMLQVFQQSLPPDQLDRLYTADTIDYSAFLCNSAVGYLEKWRASGIPMKYTAKAVDKAMERDDTYLLNWWINESGLELKFENGVDLATEFGSTSALEFWKNSGLPIEYTEAGIDNACKRVPRESLRWWKESSLEMRYSEKALDYASCSAWGLETLNWFRESGLQIKNSENAFHWATSHGCTETLQWWKDSGLELRCDATVLLSARDTKVLDWWKDSSGTDFVQQVLNDAGGKQILVDDARENGRLDVVEWWETL